MRRGLLVFMVLLLALRGLVGEAMAGQMLQHGAPALLAQATHEAGAGSVAPAHDCGGHHEAAAAADESPAVASDAPGDCPTCAICQVCSSVALSPSVQTPAAVRWSQAPPQSVQRAHSSAEPALTFKPPRG